MGNARFLGVRGEVLTKLYAWQEVNAVYFTSVKYREIKSKSFVHDVKSCVGDAVAIIYFLMDDIL